MASAENDLTNHRRHILVVVLGDVGRSPRMQYHARSLLENGHYVSLVGYQGENLIPELQKAPEMYIVGPTQEEGGTSSELSDEANCLLNVIRFEPYSPGQWMRKYIKPLYLLFRLIGLFLGLCHALWFQVPRGHEKKQGKANVDCILVQNPPSIPLLMIAFIYSRWCGQNNNKRPGFVIDWHNLGYTMFDVSNNHPIRVLAYMYEKYFAPLADGHLCVTQSMSTWLEQNFEVQSTDNMEVLRDRPPEFFCPTSLKGQHDLMRRLRHDMVMECPNLAHYFEDTDQQKCSSLLTTSLPNHNGTDTIVKPRSDRPALVVSSTSWTPDEDFSILLDALIHLDDLYHAEEEEGWKIVQKDGNIKPKIRCVIIVTGKGPQKEMYKEKIAQMKLKHICVLTMWLEASDYPILLGCADLGISLHLSTSGLDLPMKVLDFYGCEVPVCAVDFPCLDELVQDRENGEVFRSNAELATQMFELLRHNERDAAGLLKGRLELYRERIRGMDRWRDNWNKHALGVILKSCSNVDESQKIDQTIKSKSD